MKNILKLTALICLFSTTIAHAQNVSGQFVINGSVNAPNNTKVALSFGSIKDASYISVEDNTSIQNNSFTLTGYLAEPTMATLVIDGARFRFGIEASIMDLTISDINTDAYTLEGSLINWHLDKINLQQSKLRKQIFQLKSERISLLESEQYTPKHQQAIDSLESILATLEIDYIKENPSYYFGLPHITHSMRSVANPKETTKEAREIYNTFPTQFKQTHSAKLANNAIRSRENTQIGATAPEFKTTDINNNPIALSDFKHEKYVLLDAWASWCAPCVQSIPHIKKLYEKYHTKGLDVIAISRDNDKKAWHDAIEKYSTQAWHHVLAEKEPGAMMKGHFIEDDIYNLYPIMSIPKYFLIDKEGVVIGSWEEYSNENMNQLDNMLFEIFNKK